MTSDFNYVSQIFYDYKLISSITGNYSLTVVFSVQLKLWRTSKTKYIDYRGHSSCLPKIFTFDHTSLSWQATFNLT